MFYSLLNLLPFLVACIWLYNKTWFLHRRIYRYGEALAVDMGNLRVIKASKYFVVLISVLSAFAAITGILKFFLEFTPYIPGTVFLVAFVLYFLHKFTEATYCGGWYETEDRKAGLIA